MRKYLKILFIFLFGLLVIGLSKNVEANSISKISMDIYINENGDANVTEIWDCSASSGTEVYHPYYNLGNSKIKDLRVSENGVNYATQSSWDTSGSLSSKANKCGINKISNGVELCWGITSYKTHTYKVQYTITNFVSELEDSQMIYWTLIPYDFSNSIGSVDITMHADFFIEDTIDVWGYGNYGGLAYVNDGKIHMQSDGSLATSEYMTILVKFPSGTFKTSNVLDNDFDYYYEMAEDGAESYSEPKSTFFDKIISFFAIIFNFLFYGVIIIIAMFGSKKISSSNLKFGPEGKSIPKDVPYFRDIPCKGDIFRAYYIGQEYGLLKNKTDILGAIILKWLKESIIRVEQKEVGKIFKKEDTVIILNETDPETSIKNEKERKIFKMLVEASKDGILENKEFEKWCKKSYSRILGWFDDILREEKNKLVEEGLITVEEKTSMKIFTNKVYTATPELKQEAIELAGLKRYLKEYTLIKDREAIEVTIFEEYLICAQLLGIAKQVAKDFKDLYPEIIEQSKYSSYDNIVFINYCAASGISSANSARAAAQSYSSGGGGFSSGGGGGGSFGGRWRRRRIPLIINIKEEHVNPIINMFFFYILKNKVKI